MTPDRQEEQVLHQYGTGLTVWGNGAWSCQWTELVGFRAFFSDIRQGNGHA